MSSQVIDEKIVRLKMDYSSVEKGAGRVTSTLGRIADSIRRLGAKANTDVSKSISDIGSKASSARPLIDQLGDAATNVGNKFSVLKTVAVGALMQIGATVVQKASQFASAFTTDPIRDGFREYEEKMRSIQTILANTTKDGTTLADINKELNELNTYADKTIYSFADMTKSIGLFTNSGLGVKESTSMIKGWSNVVAGAGGNAEDASRGAYQLSQELAQGKMTLMGWNSMVNAKAGNNNMKSGLIEIAKAMGKFNGVAEENVPTMENFRDTLQDGWLTTDITSAYLRIMAGDMDDAGMAALGLSADQVKSFKAQQKAAEEAATKVRTFTQLIGTLKEAVGSGWATTWELLLGDFNSATTLFSGIGDALSKRISDYSNARNDMVKAAVKLGARDDLIAGLNNAFKALLAAMKPVGDAFREVFPPMTAQRLKDMMQNFKEFTANLIPSAATLSKFHNIALAVFTVVKDLASVFKIVGSLILSAFPPNFGTILLDGANKLATLILQLHNFIVNCKSVQEAVEKLKDVLSNLWKKSDEGTKKVEKQSDSLEKLKKILSDVGDIAKETFDRVKEGLSKIDLTDILHGVGFAALGSSVLGASVAIQTLVSKFKKFKEMMNFKSLGPLEKLKALGQDLKGGIVSVLDAATSRLKALTLEIKAKALLTIAGAVAVLAVSLTLLSTINAKDLAVSLGAVTASLLVLTGAMATISKLKLGGPRMMIAVASMLALSGAMLVLSGALKVMSTIDPKAMAVALTGLAVALTLMTASVMLIGGTGVRAIIAANAMVVMAGAILALTVPILIMSRLSWSEIGKGLTAVGAGLAIMVATLAIVNLMGPKVLVTVGALMTMATAMNILMKPIMAFSKMSMKEIAKGLGTLAAGLLIMVGALSGLSKSSSKLVLISVAMLALGNAIKMMTDPIIAFSKMSWEEIAKGLTTLGIGMGILTAALVAMSLISDNWNMMANIATLTSLASTIETLSKVLETMGNMTNEEMIRSISGLGASLLILGLAVKFMGSNVAGAASLTIMAGGLVVLGAALKLFATMSLIDIAKGLGVLAGALTIFIVAAYAAKGAIAGMLSLMTIPIILIGVATAAYIFASGISIMSDAMVRLSAVPMEQLKVALIGLAGGIAILAAGLIATSLFAPSLLVLGAALVTLAAGMALAGAGVFALASGFRILAALDLSNLGPNVSALAVAIITLGSAIAITLGNAFLSFLGTLGSAIPLVISMFVKLAQGILQAVSTLAPQLAATFVIVAATLILSLQTLLPMVFSLISNIITQVLDLLVTAVPQFAQAAVAIINGVLQALADGAFQFAAIGLQIIQNFLNGIASGIPGVVVAVTNIIVAFLDSISSQIPRIVDSAMNLILSFINALADATEVYGPQITSAIQRLLTNVINIVLGLVGAMASAAFSFIGGFINMAVSVASTIWGRLSGFFAPLVSRVVGAIGSLISTASNFIQGFIRGAVSVAGGIWNAISGFFTSIPGKIAGAIGNLYDSGASVISGFVSGLTSGLEGAKRKVSGALSAIRGLFPFSPAKEGPFSGRGWVTYSGKSILPAFTKGLVQNVGNSVDKTKNAMSKIREALTIDDYQLPALQGIDLSGTASVYTNQVVEGSATFETKLLDKFNKLKDDISDSFDSSIKKVNDRAIVVENYMDKTKVGSMVAQPVKETNEKRQRIIDAVSGKGVN